MALGGTIASSLASAEARGITPSLGVANLLASIPAIETVAEVDGVDFRRMPSGDLTFVDLVELAGRIDEALHAGAHGVVVIQGTDTLEETAFALELLVRTTGTVVVTGAMRSPNEVGHDGPANVLAAVRVAAAPRSAHVGCVVVMNDEIHAARFARKTHSTSPATFRSPSAGPLGWCVEGRVRWTSSVRPLADVGRPVVARLAAVAILRLALGDDARLIESLARLDYAGAVIEGFGAGHAPARVVDALETLAQSVPVVLASRTGAGEVLSATYGYPGGEIDLLHRGLVSSGALDALKARVALTLALAAHDNRRDALDAFARVVASVTHE
ncbi:MAG TPA: asparaginase [Acidimicrobiales bacterium]|nr:asparaginase [Acidimicrobiales bacterium]